MLGALAGGDSLEIVVMLKDLSAAGFRGVERNLKSLEGTANSTNLSGFSKATKGAEADVAKLAGKEAKGGGGIGGLAAGLLGLAGGPATIAIGAIGGVALASVALERTYQEVEKREKSLAIALAGHGESLDVLRPKIDESIKTGEKYGKTAADVETVIITLTEANLTYAQVQAALPHILDLAAAKHISAGEAADGYTKAIYGSARMLKQYGIVLPAVTAAQIEANGVGGRLIQINNGLTKAIGDQASATTSMDVESAKMSNTWDRLSTSVGPAVEAVFTVLIAVVDGLATSIGDILGPITSFLGILGSVVGTVVQFGGAVVASFTRVTATTETAIGKMSDDIGGLGRTTDTIAGKIADDLVGGTHSVVESTQTVANAVQALATKWEVRTARMAVIWTNFRDRMIADAKAIVIGAFDKIILGQDLTAINAEIVANRLIVASHRSTKTEIANAQLKLVSLEKSQAGYLFDLAAAGDMGSALVKATVADLTTRLASSHGAERDAIALEILQWGKLGDAIRGVPNRQLSGTHPGGGGPQKFASGGYVPARPGGTLAIIGEAGQGEYVIPESRMGSVGGGQSITVHTVLKMDGVTIADLVERHLGLRLNLHGTSTGMGSI